MAKKAKINCFSINVRCSNSQISHIWKTCRIFIFDTIFNASNRQMSKLLCPTHYCVYSDNLMCQFKYCIQTCFWNTLVQLSLIDMLRSYHAGLGIAPVLQREDWCNMICLLISNICVICRSLQTHTHYNEWVIVVYRHMKFFF